MEQREQACVTEHLTRQIVQGGSPYYFLATTSAFRRRASISNREYEYKCKIQQVTIDLRAIVSATIVDLYRLCTGPGPGVIELWKSCFSQGQTRAKSRQEHEHEHAVCSAVHHSGGEDTVGCQGILGR